MRKKNGILLLILAISITLIASIRYYIKKDTRIIQQTQLRFFSKKLDIQKKLILASYHQTAHLIFEQICFDPAFNQLFAQFNVQDESACNALMSEIEAYNQQKLRENKHHGIALLTFKPVFPFQPCAQVTDSLNLKTSNSLKDTLLLKDPYSFSISNNFIGYQYTLPYRKDQLLKGYFCIGFDFHTIRDQLLEANSEIDMGYVLVTQELPEAFNKMLQTEFKTSPYLPNCWIDHAFHLPFELLNNKANCIQMNQALQAMIDHEELNNHSLYLNSQKEAIYLSISELEFTNQYGHVFLVALNHDQLLTLVKRLNRAAYIINILIILLGGGGILYLVNSRIKMIKQRNKMQKTEADLKAINESKDKFFSIIAHDLKNPFNGIIGMSGYLATEYDQVDDLEKKEIINDINVSSKNAFNLLQNLLEWTRTQSGAIKNRPVTIDPRHLIELSLETVSTQAKNKDIEIIQTYLTLDQGYADDNLISTVIRNLCTNAIKFSPRNSNIEIIVKTYENELVFCVKDEGIGMSDDEIDQLFRIDLNFHKRGTEKEAGSGLGLKLCKEFVQYCNGRLWVISEPGKGSSFFFTIPLLVNDKTP
ncbi:MAG: HAMP domain-containing histidine kinase [Prolixibacteraceae bacterium]|nr:HAMP domain-containing histidine kinase [Prolixibacteraceae bacterium]